MTLNEYVAELQTLISKNPKYGDMQLIYSTDDEGNNFNIVYCHHSPGFFQDEFFIPEVHFEDWEDELNDLQVNSICIN